MGLSAWIDCHFDLWKGGANRFAYLQKRYLAQKNPALKRILRIKLRKLMVRYGSDLPINNKMPEGCRFPHGLMGIFVSREAVIGKDCVIFQHVTIGSNTLPDSSSKGAPVLGDHVFIGAGAKIIGNVHIGDNVRIGSNCVVAKDVPANSTVVPAAARVIEHAEARNNQFTSIFDYRLSKQQENNT